MSKQKQLLTTPANAQTEVYVVGDRDPNRDGRDNYREGSFKTLKTQNHCQYEATRL
jgi:hypothetical protein